MRGVSTGGLRMIWLWRKIELNALAKPSGPLRLVNYLFSRKCQELWGLLWMNTTPLCVEMQRSVDFNYTYEAAIRQRDWDGRLVSNTCHTVIDYRY